MPVAQNNPDPPEDAERDPLGLGVAAILGEIEDFSELVDGTVRVVVRISPEFHRMFFTTFAGASPTLRMVRMLDGDNGGHSLRCQRGTFRTRGKVALQLKVDIDEAERRTFMELFSMVGTDVALLVESEQRPQASQERPQPVPARSASVMRFPGLSRRGPGALALVAMSFCRNPAFLAWVHRTHGAEPTEDGAAQWIKSICGVTKRTQIDGNAEATRRFHALVRLPFLRSQETTAATD